METPTRRIYTRLDQAYDFLNAALFGGTLPHCVITMQRRNNSYGYFVGRRFADAERPGEDTDEIAMSPVHVETRSATDVLATLAHDMTHLWQYHQGTPSRPGYHNRAWAHKMASLGMIAAEGQATGQKVSYSVAAGGAFERACGEFLANGPVLLYQDRAREGEAASRSHKAGKRTRYACPCCRVNAWAKSEVSLWCGTCRKPLEATPSATRASAAL